MPKPSPLAARMLRAMIRYHADIRMTQHSHGRWYTRADWIVPKARWTTGYLVQSSLEDISPRRNNIRSAENNGWIKIYKKDERGYSTDFYYRITDAGREAIEALDAADFHPKEPEISHDQLKRFMASWYREQMGPYVYLPELYYNDSRIDGYSIALWHSLGFRSIAYEMKASRSDLLSELRNPDKRHTAMQVSNQFFFVTPRKLVSPGEVPEDCGLIEIDTAGRVHVVVDSPMRGVPVPGWRFVGVLMRRAKAVFRGQVDDAGYNKLRYL